MPDIPDISSMSPDRWLSKMQKVREDLLEEFEEIFEISDDTEEGLAAFRDLFAEYTVHSETGDSERLLDVDERDERLVFSHTSADETVEVACDDDGVWERTGAEAADEPEDLASRYREIGIAALELIPWWTEGAFARRVGRPRDFLD